MDDRETPDPEPTEPETPEPAPTDGAPPVVPEPPESTTADPDPDPDPEPDPETDPETAATEPSASELALAEIRAAECEVRAAEADWAEAKEEAKVKKSYWESAVERLQRTIRRSTEKLPLFDAPRPTATEPARPVGEAVAVAVADPPKSKPVPPADDSWRTVSLSALVELGMPEATRALLEKADLFTVGQVADFTAADRRLTDVKGIGESKATQIEDALARFWAGRAADPAEAEDDPAEDESA